MDAVGSAILVVSKGDDEYQQQNQGSSITLKLRLFDLDQVQTQIEKFSMTQNVTECTPAHTHNSLFGLNYFENGIRNTNTNTKLPIPRDSQELNETNGLSQSKYPDYSQLDRDKKVRIETILRRRDHRSVSPRCHLLQGEPRLPSRR